MEKITRIELAVIINSFNRLSLLKECLASLCNELSGADIEYAIVVFDANSNDGSREWLEGFAEERSLKNFSLIIPEKNDPDSFSFGVNTASAYAIEKYPDLKYFLLYETDNFINSPEPIINSIRLLKSNSEIAACGFTVKKHNGDFAGFGSSFPSIFSFILGQQLSFKLRLNSPSVVWNKNSFCEYSYVDVVYTSPLVITKESWQKVNGFDTELFPFSDCDIDLAYRIKLENQKMAVIKTSSVIHDNLEIKSSWSATRTINFYKARLRYFKKHFGDRVNMIKPFLFLTHLAEYSVLFCLMLAGKRNADSLRTRAKLIKSVFSNYKIN